MEENVSDMNTGVEVGYKAPAFELSDEEGDPFKLLEKLEKGR